MGIRSLISGFSLAALVTAGMTAPTMVQAGDVKVHLHGHFIGHNHVYKHHYGHRRVQRYRYGHYNFFPRHNYGRPSWYGRKHRYGQRYRNPGFDTRYRKHQRRQARRGFSDVVVAPQPRRKRR
jgi:hypothetical protein